MNPTSGRCTWGTGTRRWHKQSDSLRLSRLLASSPPLLSISAAFQQLFAGFFFGGGGEGLGFFFKKHSCRSGSGLIWAEELSNELVVSSSPFIVPLLTSLVLFMIFFFSANLIWSWISKLLCWMTKRTNAKHQDGKKTQHAVDLLGTLLPVIITLVILQPSFSFIFDTLHLFLIMWNLCVNTVTGHIVYKMYPRHILLVTWMSNNILFFWVLRLDCISKDIILRNNQKKKRRERRKLHAVHTIKTKSLHGLSGRQAPQETPQPANLPCQSTMVTLSSRENAGRCRLTPALAIKHENKTIKLTRGSQLMPRGALPSAHFNLQGV